MYEHLATTLKAMAHPTRLHILDMLRAGELCVCHLEAALGKRQAYVSQQLMVLRDAGLVAARKDGLRVFYRLVDVTYTVALLDALIGPLSATEPIADCPCPRCQEEPIHVSD